MCTIFDAFSKKRRLNKVISSMNGFIVIAGCKVLLYEEEEENHIPWDMVDATRLWRLNYRLGIKKLQGRLHRLWNFYILIAYHAILLLKMARNSEKAQSMLFRFRESQAADLGILDVGRTRRPKAITTVTAIPACEKWRGQVLKEISRKVSRIQEASLSDYMIRDLNDEINKLMKEKWVWEVQIRNLGGPNYMRGGGKVYDEEGREIPGGGKGYK